MEQLYVVSFGVGSLNVIFNVAYGSFLPSIVSRNELHEGNTKLASLADGKTLIETRAEGGYVIVAPSRNGERGWELMSGGFDQIAYATREEWATVVTVLMSFDATAVAPPPPSAVAMPSMLRLGGRRGSGRLGGEEDDEAGDRDGVHEQPDDRDEVVRVAFVGSNVLGQGRQHTKQDREHRDGQPNRDADRSKRFALVSHRP